MITSLIWITIALLLGLVAVLVGTNLLLVELIVVAVMMAVITAVWPELSLVGQLGLCLAGLLLLTPLLSWFAARASTVRRQQLIGAAADYAGRSGVILGGSRGVRVQVGGEVFPVRADDHRVLHPGVEVSIVRLEGITAIVRPRHD